MGRLYQLSIILFGDLVENADVYMLLLFLINVMFLWHFKEIMENITGRFITKINYANSTCT